MKKLPIGIQDIKKIRTQDYIYIDKTQFALDLIEGDAPHYFLSRPRRFGKSLFLSTLAEIFKGNKTLFEGCHIVQSNHNWQSYPVLSLNFGAIANKTTAKLETNLSEVLISIGQAQGVEVQGSSLEFQLDQLVKSLAKKEPVAILIDEYDKPLIDNLHNLEVAESNRKLLQSFYSALKSLDEYTRFTFITGISRFSKVSLFSGANHLKDISMDIQYAAMMGYTYEEMVPYFDDHIQMIAQEKSRTTEEVLAEIKTWYNGYRFTEAETYVYNPFSTLNYLDEKKPKNYWYASGTPTFLLEQAKKHPESMIPLSGTMAKEDELMSVGTIEALDLKALMFQTGYLTIDHYDTISEHYHLVFPNQEVSESFTRSLIKHFAKFSALLSDEMETLLKSWDLEKFIAKINSILSGFPPQMFSKADELTFHNFLLGILSGMGLRVAAESASSLGRVDLLVYMSNMTYVIELKLDKSPEKGLQQIKDKKYHVPHLGQGKSVALVGLSFSSTSRNIANWAGELLDEDGVLVRQLDASSK